MDSLVKTSHRKNSDLAHFLKRWLLSIFPVLLSLLSLQADAQYSEFDELKSLERRLRFTMDDSTRAESLIHLAQRYQYTDSLKSAEYYAKYLTFVTEKRDTVGLGNYYYLQAIIAFYEKDFEKAIELSRVSIGFTRYRNTFFYLEGSQIIIRSLYNLGRMEEAEHVGLDIIRETRFENHPLQFAKIHYYLGLVSRYLLKDEAVAYFNRAVKYLSAGPENKVLLPCYHNISLYYRDKEQIDSAYRYATLAIDLARQTNLYDNVDFISPANNLQELLIRMGRNEEAQQLLRELQSRQYDVKVNSLMYPEVSRRIGYLEYLSFGDKLQSYVLMILMGASLIFLGAFVVFNRKLKRKQAHLTEMLELNEVLARETNHRVKNNFQMMMSMLSIHSNDSNETLPQFVEHARARIASMARVHEMFLQNAAAGKTAVNVFFQEVIGSLDHSLDLHENGITISFQSDCTALDTGKIVTLGLIINELVVNSVKYAFPGQVSGCIDIRLSQSGNQFTLRYADNGRGLHENPGRSSGSGMAIVHSLARQLKSEARVMNDGGTVVEITFQE